jgi:hypothetical protein
VIEIQNRLDKKSFVNAVITCPSRTSTALKNPLRGVNLPPISRLPVGSYTSPLWQNSQQELIPYKKIGFVCYK